MAINPFAPGLDWDVRPAQPGLLRRIHLDVSLLMGLLALCGFGLAVLYSASGQDLDTVERQLIRLGIAFGLMAGIAQIAPARLRRWSPGSMGSGFSC